MLVIIPFCQANPFKQVARLLPSAKAAAESSAIRESAIEIGKMMLKDAKVQIKPPAGKKLFVAALCLLEVESKEAPESVEIEEQTTVEEVEAVDAPKQKKDSKGKKFLKSAKKAAVKVGKTTKKAAVKVGKTTKKAAGSVRSKCSGTILPDVRSSGKMRVDCITTTHANIRSFYSAMSNQRNALRRPQRTESQYITVQTNVARYIELGSAAEAGGSFRPPMSSSLAAALMLSASLISRQSFGVSAHLATSSTYLLTGDWRNDPPQGVSFSPVEAARRRDSDLASGASIVSPPSATAGHHRRGWGHADGVAQPAWQRAGSSLPRWFGAVPSGLRHLRPGKARPPLRGGIAPAGRYLPGSGQGRSASALRYYPSISCAGARWRGNRFSSDATIWRSAAGGTVTGSPIAWTSPQLGASSFPSRRLREIPCRSSTRVSGRALRQASTSHRMVRSSSSSNSARPNTFRSDSFIVRMRRSQ
ncbi:hypothetical protein T12_11784 [Trichinella patagoniensis]|uniref:Uncharacterized protein n=1 Tax=Trichinella patagoniensis TaxID=990121 RepID=A0A0V1A0F7_9BILA|nr:hypothetical protein T12_11784 [Trichinella patagoniensis]